MVRLTPRVGLPLAVLSGLAVLAPAARAEEGWLPTPDGASWTYRWSDSAYAPKATKEKITVSGRQGSAFALDWTTGGLSNPSGTVSSAGTMEFNRSDAGLINTSWSALPAPSNFPILCAKASGCANNMAGTLFLLTWGTRAPVLSEPLYSDTSWTATGGADNDVASDNRYDDTERIVVPAFPKGVTATRVT